MDTMTNWHRAPTLAMAVSVTIILTACTTTGQRFCLGGSEITIPTTDSTPPAVTIDFHMPGGSVVTRVPGDGLPREITVPTNGVVTILAFTNDAQGVKDSQIWAAARTCSGDGQNESCSGPGGLGTPSADNAEPNSVGQVGCTLRIAKQNVPVNSVTTQTRTGSVSQEVSARGVNFGGQTTRTPIYMLSR